MATDLVASALMNLYQLYEGERELMKFADQEKEKLASKLSAIVSVLQDAEEKQLKGTSRGLDDWLKKLENAVYVLEDILDDCSTEAIRNLYEGDRCCSYLLSLLHPHKIMFRRDISERMKAIVEKLNLIDQEKTQFSLVTPVHVPVVNQGQWNTNHHGTERLTSSVLTEDLVCGREKEKEDLVRLLLEDCTHREENPLVCSIVAMGGLGKTMLAQLVYNDKRVQDHFHEKIWICVSENFEMKVLIKEIIGSSSNDHDNLDLLQKELQKKLGGKRYLLVLDDVWNEDQEKWIQSSSNQILSSLEELNINEPEFIELFPNQMFRALSSVRKLYISCCLNLETLPEGFKYLSSLEELKLLNCDNLVDISSVIYFVPSLQKLTLWYTAIRDGLPGLPHDIPRCLPVLQNLRYICFAMCNSLCSVPDWLCDAINLEEIHIFYCSKVKSIPKYFRCLTKLKCLVISGCLELSRRCRKETGEDWNNIKHIPQITIEVPDSTL